jgi:hypothetical protein
MCSGHPRERFVLVKDLAPEPFGGFDHIVVGPVGHRFEYGEAAPRGRAAVGVDADRDRGARAVEDRRPHVHTRPDADPRPLPRLRQAPTQPARRQFRDAQGPAALGSRRDRDCRWRRPFADERPRDCAAARATVPIDTLSPSSGPSKAELVALWGGLDHGGISQEDRAARAVREGLPRLRGYSCSGVIRSLNTHRRGRSHLRY